MKKTYTIVFSLLIFSILTIVGCKAETVTTTIVSTVTPQASTLTTTKTVTGIPQTSTITDIKTITTTILQSTSANTTSSTASNTETQTELSGVETEVQFIGMAEWDFVISNVSVSSTSNEVFVKLNVNSMYQISAFIEVEYYDAGGTILGTSDIVEVKIIQAGTVRTAEIRFSIDDPSEIAKCIIKVSEEE